MICRIWRGWTNRENAEKYEAVVRQQVIPGIEARQIPGFMHIDLMRRELEAGAEFQTIMWFDNIESVVAFMGNDYETAHVPAAAVAVLDGFDAKAVHFEVIDRRSQGLAEA